MRRWQRRGLTEPISCSQNNPTLCAPEVALRAARREPRAERSRRAASASNGGSNVAARVLWSAGRRGVALVKNARTSRRALRLVAIPLTVLLLAACSGRQPEPAASPCSQTAPIRPSSAPWVRATPRVRRSCAGARWARPPGRTRAPCLRKGHQCALLSAGHRAELRHAVRVPGVWRGDRERSDVRRT